MKVTQCRLCLGLLGDPILNLGSTPLANEYLEKPEPQDLFPLEVCACTKCGHYQLNEQVEPERMFRHYLFVAGTSPVNVQHFRQYAEDMSKLMHDRLVYPGRRAKKRGHVLDIASNDGTLLGHFKDLGWQVLGIDPALNLAKEAAKKGIPTISDFFTESKADEILAKHGKFNLITANNVFAHVPDMIGFTKGVKKLLAPNGIYTFEVSYFGDVAEKLLFDTIYHEHTSYHTLLPLYIFFKNHGMEIFRVERISNHGGSVRVFVKETTEPWEVEIYPHIPGTDTGVSCGRNLQYFLPIGMGKIEQEISLKVISLNEKISNLGESLRDMLSKVKAEGKSIAIYGTPAKATTLMYALGIDEKQIDFAVDDAPLKQGRFTPGKHIPILHPDAIYERKPDVLLVLAWNFAESIMKKHSNFNGKWIVPIPELREY